LTYNGLGHCNDDTLDELRATIDSNLAVNVGLRVDLQNNFLSGSAQEALRQLGTGGKGDECSAALTAPGVLTGEYFNAVD
jgi:hypothetical protein